MASLNWCGFSAIETLRRSTDLALHGHRNGFGALSRHPLLGIGFQAYQALWRLAGVDHMHVHGLQGKFAQAGRGGDRVRARLRRAAGGERGRPGDAGLLLGPVGRHRAGHLRARSGTPTCCSWRAAASWRIPAARRPASPASARPGTPRCGGRAPRRGRAGRSPRCAQALEAFGAAMTAAPATAGTATTSPAPPTRWRTLARRGLRALLFLAPARRRAAGARGPLDAVGIAGASRGDGARRDGAGAASRSGAASGSSASACCTTSAARPSTARRRSAASASPSAALRPFFPNPFRPVVGGQPNLGRYCSSATSSPRRAPAAPCTASTAIPP